MWYKFANKTLCYFNECFPIVLSLLYIPIYPTWVYKGECRYGNVFYVMGTQGSGNESRILRENFHTFNSICSNNNSLRYTFSPGPFVITEKSLIKMNLKNEKSIYDPFLLLSSKLIHKHRHNRIYSFCKMHNSIYLHSISGLPLAPSPAFK